MAAITLAALTSSAGADWQQWLTRPLNVDLSQSAWYPQLAAIDGDLYVTWSENVGQIQWVHVAKLSPTGAWQTVGGPLNTSLSLAGFYPNITAVGPVPYVTWSECDRTSCGLLAGLHTAYVARFDTASSSWQRVGGNLGGYTSSVDAQFSDIADVAGVPWVTWDGYSFAPPAAPSPNQVFAAHMNAAGTGWVQAPGFFANGGITDAVRLPDYPNPGSPRIADVGGAPYIMYTQFAGGFTSSQNQLFVVHLTSGGVWQQVGGALNFDPTASVGNGDIAAVGSEPYVAWDECEPPSLTSCANSYVRVEKMNAAGDGWVRVGGILNVNPGHHAFGPRIAVIGGVPFVSWLENEDNGSVSIRVARLNAAGEGWDHVGSPIAIGTLNGQAIGSVNGVPFVAWQVLAAPQPAPTDWLLRAGRLEPEFLSASATPTATGATLSARMRTYGVSYPVGFQFGAGLTSTTATVKTSGDIATVTEKVSGLTPQTVYPYRPFAIVGTPAPLVLGVQQSFTTLAPDTQPPSAPRSLGARFSRGTLSFRWQSSSDNVGVDHYQLDRDGKLVTRIAGGANRFSVRGFRARRRTVFALVAFDAAGNESAASNHLTVTPRVRPAGVPRVIPAWALRLYAWQTTGRHGRRPTTPKRLPTWYARWLAWRLAPYTITS